MTFKSGFIVIIGRPNVGKSTMVNYLTQKKIAVVSDKPQTTRHTVRAVINKENAQIIAVDTPGLHKPKDEFSRYLNEKTLNTLGSVDIIAMMVDASQIIGTGDCFIAEQLEKINEPKILLLNKVDLISDDELHSQMEVASHLGKFDNIIPISCTNGQGIDDFLSIVTSALPEGPKYYPEGMITDQPEEQIIAEFIREKVCAHAYDEIPHCVYVQVTNLASREDKNIVDVGADIIVERESQKAIVIGRGAKMLKEIGKEARIDIQNLLGSKVFLQLHVKVKKNWRKKPQNIEVDN